MFRAARLRVARACLAPGWPGRMVAALLALFLLGSIDGLLPGAAQAGSPVSVAAIRGRQLRAERSMRRADLQIAHLLRIRAHRQRGSHQAIRRLERATHRRDAVRARAERLRQELVTARDDRDRTLRVHPSPTGHQVADRAALRRRVDGLQHRIHVLAARAKRLTGHVDRARQARRIHARGVGRARVAARVREREGTESVLSSQITLMMALSKARAASHVSASTGHGFARPARGHTTQGYGCQASRRIHGQRRCVRFHDGIDIAAPLGTPVRAAADGYVAYVGWNPWDRGRRSYVVIIGHAQGIESIYAHLRPSRMVNAGQFVRRGQRIAAIGLTGHTSGPHVHWEVSRNFHDLNPLRAGR